MPSVAAGIRDAAFLFQFWSLGGKRVVRERPSRSAVPRAPLLPSAFPAAKVLCARPSFHAERRACKYSSIFCRAPDAGSWGGSSSGGGCVRLHTLLHEPVLRPRVVRLTASGALRCEPRGSRSGSLPQGRRFVLIPPVCLQASIRSEHISRDPSVGVKNGGPAVARQQTASGGVAPAVFATRDLQEILDGTNKTNGG